MWGVVAGGVRGLRHGLGRNGSAAMKCASDQKVAVTTLSRSKRTASNAKRQLARSTHPSRLAWRNATRSVAFGQQRYYCSKEMSTASKRVLLPTDVKPVLYHLHLKPNFENFTFSGSERVELTVHKATRSVSFHGLDLDVQNVKIELNGQTFAAKSVSYDKLDEVHTAEFDTELPAGSAPVLSVDFSGVLTDKMVGFYRSKYTYNGKEHHIATTQFEPVDARRAFPCWDEPAVKAKFEVTLTFPSNYNGLSNMPAVSETVESGMKTVKFDVTPIMSTYLLAFVVGEFEYVEGKTRDGVTMRVWTPLGKVDKGKFALDVGTKVLQYFSDYFNIAYPLPKQDMIAIPDFAAGAMENWGLITYRESALLCDESSSVSILQRVAYVVAHELAHQWFGNLVTMEWWKELWLNEGFATFIGNQAVDVLFPQWEIWTQFTSSYLFNALRLDALLSSHPIEVEVHRSREIDEIFDAISYSKGASVIRMLATFLGEKNFQKGLQIYLKRHQYANATTQDLWQALSESSGIPVKDLMHHWTASIGYPVVNVERKDGGKCLHVHQERFLSSGRPTAEQDTTVWHLHLPVVGQSHPDVSFFEVNKKEQDIALPANLEQGWLKANAGQSAVVRVKYSEDLLAALNTAIEKLQLSATDRLGVVADAFALSKAGQIKLSQALSISRAFVNETDYSVWSDLSGNMATIAALWEAEPSFPNFQKYVRTLYSKIGDHLGWEQKAEHSDLDKLLRAVVISRLGDSGDEKTIAEALKRFAAFQQDPKSLPADLLSVVFKFVMRQGGEKEYDEMVKLFKAAEMPEYKLAALRGIGFSKKPELIQRALDYLLSGEVRKQDLFYLLSACASTPQGRDLTWAWVKKNWATRLVPEFQGGMGLLGAVIKYSLDGYASNAIADEVEAFFKENGTDDTKRTVAQVVESIRANAAWLARNREDVEKFLSDI